MSIVVILGPTSAGKSALAIRLAKRFGGEIISADSRQVYRGMDLGTGKVSRREQRMVPHHLLDVASPTRTFTVAQFQRLAERAISEIAQRGRIPFLAGGTPFYVSAIVDRPSFPRVSPNRTLRNKLSRSTALALFNRLKKMDPARAGRIDPFNKRRLIRALEIIEATRKTIPLHERLPRDDTLIVGITVSRDELKKRIVRRLDSRLRRRMIAEVRRLHGKGLSWKRLESFGLEYRWIARYILSRSARSGVARQNKVSRNEMKRLIIRDSMRLVRRQMSWWKKDNRIHWITKRSDATRLVKDFLSR